MSGYQNIARNIEQELDQLSLSNERKTQNLNSIHAELERMRNVLIQMLTDDATFSRDCGNVAQAKKFMELRKTLGGF